jgi:hypothetical protein
VSALNATGSSHQQGTTHSENKKVDHSAHVVEKKSAETLLKTTTVAPSHHASNATSLLHTRGKLAADAHHDIHNKSKIAEVQIASKTESLKTFETTEHKHGHKYGHKHGHRHKLGTNRTKSKKAPGIIVFGPPAPTYIPKIGIANVTTATALPPLPPTLNPVEDYQPADTAIGDYIMKQFVVPPTVTPPPLQSAINAAFSCPLLILPGRIWVETPSGCTSDRHGVWYDASRNVLTMWNESCVAFPDAVNADMKYTLPYGDTMGTSVTHLSWSKDVVEIFDCSAGAMYTFTEKVWKRENSQDEQACTDYGVCGYELFFQYYIHSATGALMASTAYLTYFQREFTLVDPALIPIATLGRKGNWNPRTKCPDYEKEWVVTFGGSASPLTAPPNRWIVAAFTTVLSLRDENRDIKGFIQPSRCQKWSMSVLAFTLVVSLAVAVVLSICFWLFIKEKVTVVCFQLEEIIFPRTMYKASKYDP